MRRTVGGLLIALVVLGIGYALWSAGPRVPDRAVLVLELGGPIADAPPTDTLAQLRSTGAALPTLLMLLDMAAVDERVEGVLVHVRGLQMGYARVQELRDALGEVREAGKDVAVLLDLGSLNATREVYLASVANKVYVVPGYLGPLAGIAGQYMQMAGFFEKLGIRWEYARVGKYKSAVENFASEGMSEPARQMTNQLLDGIYSQIVGGIAEGRNLSPNRVQQLIEAAPGTADELIQTGLVDGVVNRNDVLKAAEMGDLEEIEAGTYQRVGPNAVGLRDGPKIALIFGDGPIVQGGGGRSWSKQFDVDVVASAVEEAMEDDSIRAIVLRINSGGGSALASEQLWQVVRRARDEKPVVVSMGDAAASGGYYIASAAHSIVAAPATLTGSIGVFMMRPAFSGLYEKLDINTEVIARGQHAQVSSSDLPMTTANLERVDFYVNEMYRGFLNRVSEGRSVDADEVDRLGQGRVWLGTDALANGLVDEIGGLSAAVERARIAAEIPDDVDPARVILPGARSASAQLRQLLRGDLVGWFVEDAMPFELPEILTWAWLPRPGEVAYIPTEWVEID